MRNRRRTVRHTSCRLEQSLLLTCFACCKHELRRLRIGMLAAFTTIESWFDMSTSLLSTPKPDTAPSRSVLLAIGALSLLAVAFLIWLIYFNGGTDAPEWISFLPAVNA